MSRFFLLELSGFVSDFGFSSTWRFSAQRDVGESAYSEDAKVS